MNDLISRSELIAQLEGFKLSLGDVILGFVVGRVIERVQEMPAVPPAEVWGRIVGSIMKGVAQTIEIAGKEAEALQ